MKKLFFILMAAVMLSGCAKGVSGDDGDAGSLNVVMVSPKPVLLTDSPFEDYKIMGWTLICDQETLTQTRYEGEVSEEVAAELWELLCDIEKSPSATLEGGQTVGGGNVYGGFTFINKNTGDVVSVRDGILYESPELCGGTSVTVIGGRYYGGGLSNELQRLLEEGVVREENFSDCFGGNAADIWADRPEKLTDLNFDDLEFLGKASVFDPETRITTDYQGNIADESRAELWAVLKAIEECEPVDLGENGSVGGGCFNGCLWITDTVTGDEYCIYDGIYYSSPMLDGGPTVICVDGRFRDGSCSKYYFPVGVRDGDGYSTFDMFKDIFLRGLVCEKNVYARVLPSEPIVVEKKDIALVHSYCNWAEGHQHYGEFIDLAGNVYRFDLSEEDIGSDEEFIKALEDGHFSGEFGEPTVSIKDTDVLWEIVGLADNVAEDAEIVETHKAYDAGQDTIYAVNSEHTLVEVYSTGDFNRVNTDGNAMKILAIQRRNGILQ